MIDKDSDAYKAGEAVGNTVAEAIQQALLTGGFFIPVIGDDGEIIPDVFELLPTVEGSIVPARQQAIEAPKEEKS